jgi:hypothetical protein
MPAPGLPLAARVVGGGPIWDSRGCRGVGIFDDREPLGCHVADELIDVLLGADIDAARRMIEDQHPDTGNAPFGKDHLLLVAAREASHHRCRGRRLDLEPADPIPGDGTLCGEADDAARDEFRQRGKRHILGDAKHRNLALDLALAGQQPDALLRRIVRRAELHNVAIHPERSAIGGQVA